MSHCNFLNVDGDGNGDCICDFINSMTYKSTIKEVNNNHKGYFGFRNLSDNTKLVYNGSMDILVYGQNNVE